jgi:hypothetical protein
MGCLMFMGLCLFASSIVLFPLFGIGSQFFQLLSGFEAEYHLSLQNRVSTKLISTAYRFYSANKEAMLELVRSPRTKIP